MGFEARGQRKIKELVFCLFVFSCSIVGDSTSSSVVICLNIFTLGSIVYPIDSGPYLIYLTLQPRPSPYNMETALVYRAAVTTS